ncbi:MAG: acyl-CoA synthetase FdrA [Deltaproteobacteria bacterium]|nr:acyl-CoA synthetase FdrA [Deltaproteobacteria bacterium]
MKKVIVNQVKTGFYLDSVALMRFSRTIAGMDDVEEAALMMGTPSNKKIMTEAGILGPEGEKASGGDLIIGIRAAHQAAADKALAESINLLEQSAVTRKKGETWRPRTLAAALKSDSTINLALISVAGEFAAAEARKALHQELNVMIFSDNVPVGEEVALKNEARELGLLVMGPDCGTAIINGVPLAFANQVKRGGVGIIGASGTGIQEVSCLISQGGGGISQAIGVGGRDLKKEVGGISTLMALEVLEADPATRHIVLISKPPAASVAESILARIKESRKNFTVCFLGASGLELPNNAVFSSTLKAAAESALGGTSISTGFLPDQAAASPPKGKNSVLGLFSGGTLCSETQFIFREAGESINSNVPIPGVSKLEGIPKGHCFIDFGDDEYTQGRPHPMIDPTIRDEALVKALSNPDVGVILIDVVIGYGAHNDPAGHLASVLPPRRADNPLVIASVTGTDLDIQNRASQVRTLEEAGILVAPSNADAALLALACLKRKGG